LKFSGWKTQNGLEAADNDMVVTFQPMGGGLMTCPHCLSQLIIDEWGGWRWWCIRCDLYGRRATDEEIEAQEREQERENDVMGKG